MISQSHRALLVAALALSALLLASAPRWASAHDHPASGASSETASADAVALSLSQGCPTNPGQMCCCAGVFALPGAGKVASADAGAWTLTVAPDAGAAKFSTSSTPPIAAPPRYQARPRAPPLSS